MSIFTHPITACVTGASGFVGSSVAVRFLELGHSVRLPFRSQTQCNDWYAKYDSIYPGKLVTILLDRPMTEEGAFDEAVQGCDVVVHTASPLPGHFKGNHEEDILKPTREGTLSLLRSAKKVPSVKNVVATTSGGAFATVAEIMGAGPDLVLTEKSWNSTTLEEALAMPVEYAQVVYMSGKAFAEKAAWEFVKQPNVTFSFSTVAPSGVLGECKTPGLTKLSDTTASFRQAWDGVFDQQEVPPFCPELFVSVNDVAHVHVEAALNPFVSNGHRYLTSIDDRYSWQQFIRTNLKFQPALKGRLPPLPDVPTDEEKPKAQYRIEAGLAEEHFNFKYEPFETFVKAYADQVYELGKAEGLF
ncbi:hypothetical protein JCM6882_001778 [Rhodosporidiobolus microsporus]